MHILQIYKDYPPVFGGIENHICALSVGLAARGHRITVLVTSRDGHTSRVHEQGVEVLRAGRLAHLASTPLSLAQLLAARALHPDLVNLHFPYPPGDLVYAALPNRPPLVVTYHSDIVRQRGLLHLYRPLLEHTLRRATRIIATSPRYVASSPWLRQHAERCTVVPLSVEPARFLAANPVAAAAIRRRYAANGPLLLFVGRLRYYKGLHFLLRALVEVRASLLLVGTGPEEKDLRVLAATLGLSERVHFVGDVSDQQLPAHYAAADVYVLPAHLRSEAFGISLLEAQAAGLPLISTELSTGTSYANEHGVTGFVVPPAAPQALARAINVLLANPLLRTCMGEAGRERARTRFSHAQMVALTERVYEQVLGSSS